MNVKIREVYEPSGSPKFKAMMAKAKKHNRDLDQIDKASGAQLLAHHSVNEQIRVSIAALGCAVESGNLDYVCQAIDMLQEAELQTRSERRNYEPM